MDADDLCVRTRLERQVAFLDANPKVGLLGCGVFDNIDNSGAVLYRSYLPEDNATIQRTLVERWCFFHSSIMFRRALYERVGGYRKELTTISFCVSSSTARPIILANASLSIG